MNRRLGIPGPALTYSNNPLSLTHNMGIGAAKAAMRTLPLIGMWLASDCVAGTLTTATDSSGNGYSMSATNMTVATRNGKNVFVFTSTNSQMVTAGTVTIGSTALWFAAVGLEATPAGANMMIESGVNGGNTAGGFSFYKGNGNLEVFYNSPLQDKQSSSAVTTWGRFLATIDTTQSAANELKLFNNNVEPSYGVNTAGETAQTFTAQQLTIGGRNAVTTHALTGNWAAFVIGRGSLTTAQRNLVDSCLQCFGGAA